MHSVCVDFSEDDDETDETDETDDSADDAEESELLLELERELPVEESEDSAEEDASDDTEEAELSTQSLSVTHCSMPIPSMSTHC